MKATVNKTFQVEEPIEKVWGFLSDPNQIVTCLPGASITEQIDEQNYNGSVTMKFGPIKASYSGKITIDNLDVENRTIVMSGKGMDSKGKGSADMLLNGNLKTIDTGTEVGFDIEITIIGMLAQFGSRLITDVTDTVFNQFISHFKDKLKGKDVDNTMNAGSMMGSVVKGMLGGKK